MNSECKIDLSFEVGECLRWNAKRQVLSWVDIPSGTYYEGSFQPDLRVERQFRVEGELGSAIHIGDDLYLLHENRIDVLGLDGQAQTIFVDDKMMSNCRYNDSNIDSHGRIVAGIMDKEAAAGRGSLVRFDPKSLSYETLLVGLTIPNGITWSKEGDILYLAESIQGVVYSAKYLEPRCEFSPLISIDRLSGYPDGLEVDSEGNIFVAIWAGSEIWKFTGFGELLEKFPLPVTNPTSICLIENQSRFLYISGRQHILEPGNNDGRLFEIV